MPMTQLEVERVAAEVLRLEAARYGPYNPPPDLVYQPASRTYWSPSTGVCYQKGSGNLLLISKADYDRLNGRAVDPAIVSTGEVTDGSL